MAPDRRSIVFLMAVFAAGYLLSSLLRGITAALAPFFGREFGVSPAELGLLAGSYFFSFALLQLPMGMFLDRWGVRAVMVGSLSIAAISCLAFAAALSYPGLLWARLLSGIGVSACLIAPLTAARLWTPVPMQQRINSWMLMAGALGLVMGTLPSESIATAFGWRPLFAALGVLFAVVAVVIALRAPGHERSGAAGSGGLPASYGSIVRAPYTWKIGAVGLFNYAILVAVQTLWIGPWLTDVGGETVRGASIGLLAINGIMLVVFLVMGYLSPRIIRSPDDAEALLRRSMPLGIGVLAWIALLGPAAQWVHFAAFCVAAWPLSVTHPLVGQRFGPGEAGRALAFFNLLLFVGVFLWQWTFGLMVTALSGPYGTAAAYQLALAALALLSVVGYAAFLALPSGRPSRASAPTAARTQDGTAP
ncbi:MFS transporter [Salinarimonas chemoclinalis]|uniref:MFS transporter n=1 Tax=Salinarimonas chemoclinalis TaxID=3241599 RepID=UPI0035584F88